MTSALPKWNNKFNAWVARGYWKWLKICKTIMWRAWDDVSFSVCFSSSISHCDFCSFHFFCSYTLFYILLCHFSFLSPDFSQKVWDLIKSFLAPCAPSAVAMLDKVRILINGAHVYSDSQTFFISGHTAQIVWGKQIGDFMCWNRVWKSALPRLHKPKHLLTPR